MGMTMDVKARLGNTVLAVIARKKGMPFSRVMRQYGFSADEFFKTIFREDRMMELIDFCEGDGIMSFFQHRDALVDVANNPAELEKICEMDHDFLEKAYDCVASGAERKFPDGTLKNPLNVEFLSYIALAKDPERPGLASMGREEAMKAVSSLPSALFKYLQERKLGGVFSTLNPRTGRNYTTLDVMLGYDKMFRKRSGMPGIYDSREELHLHEWGEASRKPSRGYLADRRNCSRIAYHHMVEDNRHLGSPFRDEVMDAIDSIPETDLSKYFIRIGIRCLLGGKNQVTGGSPLAIFELYDEAWRDEHEMQPKSIFDLTQPRHYHWWDGRFSTPNRFWRSNPEKSDIAVYHILGEKIPSLKSDERNDVLAGIRQLPAQLYRFFEETLPLGLVRTAYEDQSARTIISAYDRQFMKETGNPSLLCSQQNDCLDFNGKGMLKRQNI